MKTKTIITLLAFALLLAACNLPGAETEGQVSGPDAAFTMAAQTVEAQLTQQALLNPPTATPEPATNTPPPPTATQASLPTVPVVPTTGASSSSSASAGVCDRAQFVTDVTVQDDTVLAPGASVTKTWRIQNTGTCTWGTSYSVVNVGGNGGSLGATSPVPLSGSVAPGQSVDISIQITAPTTNGSYTSNWELRNPSGTRLLGFFTRIVVNAGTPAAGSSSSSSSVSSSAGLFAVTSVSLSSSGTCGNFTVTANITTNREGTVRYVWVRSDGATDTILKELVFASAGTQAVNYNWSVAAPGSYWVDIYIDDPNNQQFGRANFTCTP